MGLVKIMNVIIKIKIYPNTRNSDVKLTESWTLVWYELKSQLYPKFGSMGRVIDSKLVSMTSKITKFSNSQKQELALKII